MLASTVWLALGLLLAAALIVLIRRFRPNHEIQAWAQALIVAALIYVGFALAWGNTTWVVIELLGVAGYGALALAGWRHGATWVAVGWLLHPVWDLVLHLFGVGHAIVPEWYAIACLSFDFVVAGYLFYLAYQSEGVAIA